jgi:glycosyltransferase involved in cell wall biosynthesis
VRVLHIPFCFYPDAVAGTEIYVERLCHLMQSRGIEVAVAAPGERNMEYRHSSLPVFRYATASGKLALRDLYGEGDPVAAASFERVLEHWRPQVVHLHAFTSGVSLGVVRAAKRRGIPVVYTYHTPSATCMRNTLRRSSGEVCHGRINAERCTRCMVEYHGFVRWPRALARVADRLGLEGGPWTALRLPELVRLRHAASRALLAEVDRVVAVCAWGRDVLLRNGVDPAKVVVSRQGYGASRVKPTRGSAADQGVHPTRLVFLGRMTPDKGLGVLIDAVGSEPGLPVSLDIYGIAQDGSPRFACTDSRIRFLSPIPADRVQATLGNYDALIVPSQGLETGPLVVYEAFAAGIPVIGSNLGGIAELVTDEKNGLLVDVASTSAWAAALRRIVTEPGLLEHLRAGIEAPRTMAEAADDMLRLCRELTT